MRFVGLWFCVMAVFFSSLYPATAYDGYNDDNFGYSLDGTMSVKVDRIKFDDFRDGYDIRVLRAGDDEVIRQWVISLGVSESIDFRFTSDGSAVIAFNFYEDADDDLFQRTDVYRLQISDGVIDNIASVINKNEYCNYLVSPVSQYYILSGCFSTRLAPDSRIRLKYHGDLGFFRILPEGSFLAWGAGADDITLMEGNGEIKAVSIETGKVSILKDFGFRIIDGLRFTNNGRSLIIFGYKGRDRELSRVYIVDARTGKIRAKATDYIQFLSASSGLISTCKPGQSKIDIRKLSMKKKLSVRLGHECSYHRLSPDGTVLFTGVGEKWSAETGERLP